MYYYILKLIISAAIIVIVSEVAKYNAVVGGLIKSLPLISVMAIIWVYAETHDTCKVATLSISTFWFVIPTLPMFLILPFLLGKGAGFYVSLTISMLLMISCYVATVAILRWCGFQF
ncbi:hypothetical protein BH10PSE19_BH10PSE19_01550 [soil metagenome]